MTYTLAQLRAYTCAAARDDDRREVAAATAARMAMGATRREWDMYMRSLGR
ncbi:MAG TPA: hypothetical protein VGC24_08665 [Burkholderiaceae bacterium]